VRHCTHHSHHSLVNMATTLAALATVVSLSSGVQGHIPGQVRAGHAIQLRNGAVAAIH
jgi:hypothetical protein